MRVHLTLRRDKACLLHTLQSIHRKVSSGWLFSILALMDGHPYQGSNLLNLLNLEKQTVKL